MIQGALERKNEVLKYSVIFMEAKDSKMWSLTIIKLDEKIMRRNLLISSLVIKRNL